MTIMVTANCTPPGPQALPLLGGREALPPFLRDPVGFLCHLHKQYGNVVAFTHGHPTWLAVFGAEANQQLATQHDLFQIAEFPFTAAPDTALRRLTSGLPFMQGAAHTWHRQLIQPCFQRQLVAAYADNVVVLVRQMLDRWRVGAQREICQDMRDLIFRVTTQAFFGVRSDADAETLGAMVCRWMAVASSLPVALLPINLPGTPFHSLHVLSDQLEARYRAIIADKRAEPGAHADIVGALLQARDADGAAPTDDEIIGHLHAFALAGSHTSAAGLTWTLFLLDQHPAMLADLRDEVASVLRGAAPTVDDLERLPLLERVLKESLRLLPPVAYLMRRSTAPMMLGPFGITAQARIIYSPYVTHHLPELYAEPQRFRPERWLGAAPPAYAYIPFGAGGHACIGASFAMLTMRLTLAMIVQRYRLQVAPGARIDRQVQLTMSPKYGMPMTVKPRHAALIRTTVRGNIHEMVDLA